MLLQDLNHYVETHGLDADSSENGLSESNFADAQKRVSDANQYQASVHASIFKHDVAKTDRDCEKLIFLDTLGSETIDVQTDSNVIRGVPLRPLAESCDTIFTLASTRELFRGGSEDHNRQLHFSLESFGSRSVNEFLSLALERREIEDVSCDRVVDCCQIAHYMQCKTVLAAMVDILERSVDSENCLSLCELADRLEFPVLFERSLSYMMESVGNLEDDEHLWGGLSADLKKRIVAIKSAIQSSVHSQRSHLYFGTFKEYLAIFAENVEYHRIRLEDAKIGLKRAGSGKAYNYAAEKIAKQEQRVRTLEAVMEEQKKIFAGESASIGIEKKPRRSKRTRCR